MKTIEDKVSGNLRTRQTVGQLPLYDCLCVWKVGWCAEIGIVEVSSLPFQMIPRFEENTLLIEDYGGTVHIMGKGAGAIPTAAAMTGDMTKICN
jgi:hypothetical protein